MRKKGKVVERATWTIRRGKPNEVSAEVEVEVDYDYLDRMIQRVIFQAIVSKSKKALFNHGMIRARVLKKEGK